MLSIEIHDKNAKSNRKGDGYDDSEFSRSVLSNNSRIKRPFPNNNFLRKC